MIWLLIYAFDPTISIIPVLLLVFKYFYGEKSK